MLFPSSEEILDHAVTQAYNPSYLRGGNQEDHSVRPAWAKWQVWWGALLISSYVGKYK
jgi:hypothetical protein